jgi:hypothetical protein
MGKYPTNEPDNDAFANETTGDSAGATGSADLYPAIRASRSILYSRQSEGARRTLVSL